MSEDAPAVVTEESTSSPIRYPERLSYEGPDYTPEVDESLMPDEWEHTAKAYLEREWDYKETVRAINLDFKHYLSGLPKPDLEAFAAPAIERINEQRLEQGADTIDVSSIDPQFVAHITRPDWQSFMPRSNDPEELERWESFKHKWPEHMQINLEGLYEADVALRTLANDPEIRDDVQQERAETTKIIRAAVGFQKATKKLMQLSPISQGCIKTQLNLAGQLHPVRHAI